MNIEIIVGGLIGATYLVPISLAFCIASAHGKYLPLWLPYTGLLGAYVSYELAEVMRVGPIWAFTIGIATAAGTAVIVHTGLFHGHVERAEPYQALLRAIGITVFVEAGLGWATRGYALSYNRLKFPDAFYFRMLGETLTGADLAAVLSAALLAPLVVIVMKETWLGLMFRSVASNRNLARDYGLPVRQLDLAVLALGGALSALGAIMFGMKYDLWPQMIAQPTIKVAAVAVAFGNDRLGTVAAALLMIGILEAATQASSHTAPLASAIGYLILIVAVLVRHAASTLLRRRLT